MVLVVAVVAVAYGTQAPQLGVAEFAPAARQALDAPPTTSGPEARGGASSGRRSTTTTVPATATTAPADTGTGSQPATTRVARARTCVGNPPRQTADPQSPPCIAAIFEGDNGGATSTGVTATEIAVAVPIGTGDEKRKPAIELMFEYFNQYYEFYGRRLEPVFVPGSISTPPAARAVAADAASRSVFGAITGLAEWNFDLALDALYQELGRAKIVTVARGSGQWIPDRTVFDALHPYLWSVFPSGEQLGQNIADFACASLVGNPAQHLPDAVRRTQTRKFGVIVSGRNRLPVSAPVVDGLRSCGAEVQVFNYLKSGATSNDFRAGMESFKTAGVTTVVCLCEGFDNHWLLNSIDGSFEWMTSTTPSMSPEADWQGSVKPATSPLFGLMEWPKIMPIQAQTWFGAASAVRPDMATSYSASDEAFYLLGTSPVIYTQLAVLAAGIQGAGPMLTPDSFAAALMGTKFANPGAGSDPYFQASVGFGPGDHSFYDDYAIAWWSASATPVDPWSTPGMGAFCYLDHGARYRTGSYPTNADDRLFNPAEPCR